MGHYDSCYEYDEELRRQQKVKFISSGTSIGVEVKAELDAATSKFGPFNSAHEGFAVLKEEVDELWDEVKAKQGARDVAKMRKEAIQVAAMAMRFVLDVCDAEKGQK